MNYNEILKKSKRERDFYRAINSVFLLTFIGGSIPALHHLLAFLQTLLMHKEVNKETFSMFIEFGKSVGPSSTSVLFLNLLEPRRQRLEKLVNKISRRVNSPH